MRGVNDSQSSTPFPKNVAGKYPDYSVSQSKGGYEGYENYEVTANSMHGGNYNPNMHNNGLLDSLDKQHGQPGGPDMIHQGKIDSPNNVYFEPREPGARPIHHPSKDQISPMYGQPPHNNLMMPNGWVNPGGVPLNAKDGKRVSKNGNLTPDATSNQINQLNVLLDKSGDGNPEHNPYAKGRKGSYGRGAIPGQDGVPPVVQEVDEARKAQNEKKRALKA